MPLQLPDFNLSEERAEFRDTLRRFLEEHAPMTETRRVMEGDDGLSPGVWKLASEELGLAGIAIPEAHGGQGFGVGELAIALGELGRGLVPIPLFASAALAARAVEGACAAPGADGPGDPGEWLGPIAAGHAATLAWVEADGRWEAGAVGLGVEDGGSGDTVRLTGAKHFVLDAPHAERIFVVARTRGADPPGPAALDGLGLFAVEAGASGLAIQARETLDLTRPLSSLSFDGVEARVVARGDAVGPALQRALEEATALLCAEMVGGMGKVLETAVDYAAERHQFSRPIGSFQAIKHKCANLLIDYEAARTAADAATVACEDDDPERALLASVAKSHVGPAYVRMATESGQIQGGVGYTWEYDAHLFYRRALGSQALLGDASEHQESIARQLAETEVGGEGGTRAAEQGGGDA